MAAAMEIALSWDLLVIVFFAVVVAYSFIVGKDESVKIVIATYITTIAVQGIGNILIFGSNNLPGFFGFLGFEPNMTAISTIKIVAFVLLIILLAIRGGFSLSYEREVEGIWQTALTGVFGFSTAGLLLCSLLTYVAARPILDSAIAQSPSLAPLLAQSQLVQIMVIYQDVWFALPAFLLLAIGIFGGKKE
jgi:hypothetical protein